MGQMEFKMERTGLLEVGDVLSITEYELPNSYYYVLGRSYAMSGNYTTRERIKSRHGKVVGKEEHNSTFYIYVEFDE